MDTPETNKVGPVAPAEGKTMVIRLPKINLQAGLLGLVALITVFQTVQLFRINNRAGATTVKASSVSSNPSPSSHESGANAAAPQSMVGGC